jgi:hypothetical protein
MICSGSTASSRADSRSAHWAKRYVPNEEVYWLCCRVEITMVDLAGFSTHQTSLTLTSSAFPAGPRYGCIETIVCIESSYEPIHLRPLVRALDLIAAFQSRYGD